MQKKHLLVVLTAAFLGVSPALADKLVDGATKMGSDIKEGAAKDLKGAAKIAKGVGKGIKKGAQAVVKGQTKATKEAFKAVGMGK